MFLIYCKENWHFIPTNTWGKLYGPEIHFSRQCQNHSPTSVVPFYRPLEAADTCIDSPEKGHYSFSNSSNVLLFLDATLY
jgi:hypothetical protein